MNDSPFIRHTTIFDASRLVGDRTTSCFLATSAVDSEHMNGTNAMDADRDLGTGLTPRLLP
jgi:hypothetical protein